MTIGFEAKRAFTNGTGLGHYSRTLIDSLAAYYSEHEYLLFTPKITSRYQPSQANIHVIHPTVFPSSLFTSLWRSNWVKQDLKRLNIDLYHGLSHEIPMGMHKTGIPSIVTIHDLIFERYPKQYNSIDVQIYQKKFKYACQHADKIIAISKQTKEDIISFYNIEEYKISICYQSCNEAFTQEVSAETKQRVKEYYQLPDQFFLYVGSIIERKNLLTICKGLALLKDKCDIPLVIIGDGDSYKQDVKRFIQSKGLEKQVIFLSEHPAARNAPSFSNAADFPAIYQQALCMVYPSIFEGFGIPVLEALWSKIPVITSNVSCLPETGGDAAFYIDPLNETQMADALWQMAINNTLKQEMVNKGIRHAQKFTRQACAAAVMQQYQHIK